MIRSPVARILSALGVLLLLGIALKLLMGILKPILPDALMNIIKSGWQVLYNIVSPALPTVAAVAILAGLAWVAIAWLKRH